MNKIFNYLTMSLNRSLYRPQNVPINGIFDRFFTWVDEFAANASNKVFEPLINTYVGASVNITGGAGRGLGAYLENPDNVSNLVNTAIATQTGGLVGVGVGGNSTQKENFEETETETQTSDKTKTIKYILGGLALVGVGYLIIKD